MKKICDFCGEEFETNRSKARFCKRDHFGECVVCGKEFPVPQPKQPSKFCSAECRRVRPKTQVECVCQIDGCGKTFMSDRKTSRFCPDPHYRICVVCGEEFELSMSNRSKPASTCSKKCASKTIDYDKRLEKYKTTVNDRYGVENISQIDKVKEKKRQTCMDHYGVDNPSRAPEVQKKRDETFMERFGGNPLKNEEVSKRVAETCMDRYGAPNPFMLDEFQKKARDSVFKKYGVKNILMLPEIRKKAAENSGRVSRINLEWQKILEKSTGLGVEREVRFGRDFYADLGFTHEGVIVEINPSVTHNSTIPYAHLTSRCKEFTDSGTCALKHTPTYPTYHQDRAFAARDTGFTLLQYFEWMDRDIFVSTVRSALGLWSSSVNADSCVLREISKDRADEFLAENCLFGVSDSTRKVCCLGLFDNDDLIFVQTYSLSNPESDFQWELTRSCSKIEWNVQGGFDRCNDYFVDNMNPKSLVYYVDLTSGCDKVDSFGWSVIGASEPKFTWVSLNNGDGPEFIRDIDFQDDSIINLHESKSHDGTKLTNADVLMSEGYVQVFDCGTSVNVWRKQQE